MLSFIIPTYNEEKNLAVLIDKVKVQMNDEDEIVVVDSHSTDKTTEIARRAGAKVVMQPKLGIGLAKTEGAKNAKNNLLVMLDADCVPCKDFAKRIREHFKEEKLIALAGLDLYSSDNCVWRLIYNIYSIKVFYLGKIFHLFTRKYWLPANNNVIKKEVFLSVGGYRSVICEDNDLMKRLPASRNVRYDRKLIVTLSDRRFKEGGFFRTVFLWIVADLKVWFGKGTEASKYRS